MTYKPTVFDDNAFAFVIAVVVVARLRDARLFDVRLFNARQLGGRLIGRVPWRRVTLALSGPYGDNAENDAAVIEHC